MSEEAGFTWRDYVDGLVRAEGSLTAVAEKLARDRNFADDVGSVERALRRLRERGRQTGGKWGARAISVFGLPDAVVARLRWMGSYHSQFNDLPVPVCEDLVRLWDHPPTNELRGNRCWLALARASIALRRDDAAAGAEALEQVRRESATACAEARVEALLVEAFVASRVAREQVAELLVRAGHLLAEVPEGDDRTNLHMRWIDQRVFELNRKGDHAASEALLREVDAERLPPFAASRRANALAYLRWKQGNAVEAAELARAAARAAGDGGHVRLRAMALAMLVRIGGASEGERERAARISERLEDATLLRRLARLP